MNAPGMFADVQAVLFDLDGTLIDSAPDLGAAVDKMRVDRGLSSLPLAHYRSMAGAGARGMIDVAFGLSPEHADFSALREEFFMNYEQCMTQRTYAFDGISELIAHLLARDIPWGVVTNKSARFTDPLTRAIPLFESARTVISGDTTVPMPAASPATISRSSSPTYRQRMGTVAATYGYLGQKTDTAQWGAHAIINSPGGLLQLLAKV